MTHPSKRHDGRYMRLRCIGTQSNGATITGRYRHMPRRSSFEFIEAGNCRGVYMRDEWVIEANLAPPM